MGEVVGNTECLTLYPRCCTKWGRYDRVQLSIIYTIFYFSEQAYNPDVLHAGREWPTQSLKDTQAYDYNNEGFPLQLSARFYVTYFLVCGFPLAWCSAVQFGRISYLPLVGNHQITISPYVVDCSSIHHLTKHISQNQQQQPVQEPSALPIIHQLKYISKL